jgi:multisubunit Na+/H+ antiporter MnhB subunit
LDLDKRKLKKNLFKILFCAGLILFAIGVILIFLGISIPSPVANPTYQSGGLTYFFPFANYLTIGGIVLAVVALVTLYWKRKKKQ